MLAQVRSRHRKVGHQSDDAKLPIAPERYPPLHVLILQKSQVLECDQAQRGSTEQSHAQHMVTNQGWVTNRIHYEYPYLV